jgi:hypothetical protein
LNSLEALVRYKLTFLAGAAVGYVLGAKAGRARYEQISGLASKVAETEAVQRAREAAVEQATHLADVARSTVGDKVGAVVADGRQRVEEALGDKLPERLRSTSGSSRAVGVPPTMQTEPRTTNGSGTGV